MGYGLCRKALEERRKSLHCQQQTLSYERRVYLVAVLFHDKLKQFI
jgi:hypothetical protein